MTTTPTENDNMYSYSLHEEMYYKETEVAHHLNFSTVREFREHYDEHALPRTIFIGKDAEIVTGNKAGRVVMLNKHDVDNLLQSLAHTAVNRGYASSETSHKQCLISYGDVSEATSYKRKLTDDNGASNAQFSSAHLSSDCNAESDLKRFQKSMKSATITIPCLCCGTITDKCNSHHAFRTYKSSNDKNKRLKIEDSIALLEGDYAYTLEDATDKAYLCTSCYRSLTISQKVPIFAAKLLGRPGEIPSCLMDLWPMERYSISRINCFIRVYTLAGSNKRYTPNGQTATSGKCTLISNNSVSTLIKKLPRRPNKDEFVFVKQNNSTSYLPKEHVRIRPERVREALLWLRKNNGYYRDIEIDEEALDEWTNSNAEEFLAAHATIVDESPLPIDANTRDEAINKIESIDVIQGNTNIPLSAEKDIDNEEAEVENKNFGIIESFIFDTQLSSTEDRVRQAITVELDVGITKNDDSQNNNNASNNQFINDFSENNVLGLAFPQLFPNGGACKLPNTRYRLKYYRHLLMYYDRRFATCPQFLFYLFILYQKHTASRIVSIAQSRSANYTKEEFQSLTVREFSEYVKKKFTTVNNNKKAKSDEREGLLNAILASLVPFSSALQGSEAYMRLFRRNAMAIIQSPEMPPPLWYLTLSSADTSWPEIYLRVNQGKTVDDFLKLTKSQRLELVSKYPVDAAYLFKKRRDSLFGEIINGSAKPIGDITDWISRVETQLRGSLHEHNIFYGYSALGSSILEDAQTPEGQQRLATAIDQYMTAKRRYKPTSSADESEQQNLRLSHCRDDGKLPHPASFLAPILPLQNSAAQEDLRQLVNSLQYHRCTQSCSKNKNIHPSSPKFRCRFRMPRPVSGKTEVNVSNSKNSSNNVLKDLNITLKRAPDEVWTNQYNEQILRSWRGNIDLQIIGHIYGVAFYICYYITKKEPHLREYFENLHQIISNAQDEESVTKLFYRIAITMATVREISSQEAAYCLLGYPIGTVSREIVCLVIRRDHQLNFTLNTNPNQKLFHTKSSNIRMYEIRPLAYEHVGLYEFHTKYKVRCKKDNNADSGSEDEILDVEDENDEEPVYLEEGEILAVDEGGLLEDNEVKERKKPAIVDVFPKIPYDTTNEDSAFQVLQLYKPWRRENDLLRLQNGHYASNYAEALAAWLAEEGQSSGKEIKHAIEISKIRQVLDVDDDKGEIAEEREDNNTLFRDTYANILQYAERAPQLDENGNVQQDEDSTKTVVVNRQNGYTKEDYERASQFVPMLVKKEHDRQLRERLTRSSASHVTFSHEICDNQTEAELLWFEDKYYSTLSNEQRLVFGHITSQLKRQFLYKDDSIKLEPTIVHAAGGCGKSYLIDAIVNWVNIFFKNSSIGNKNYHGNSCLMAFTGVAAKNINGVTIHTALHIPTSCADNNNRSLTETAQKRLEEEFDGVLMVVIDEVGMLSCELLTKIEQRLRSARPNRTEPNLPFGDFVVLFVGDMHQLSPVHGTALTISKKELLTKKITNADAIRGFDLWRNIRNVFILTTQFRQNDSAYAKAVNEARHGNINKSTLELLNTRVIANEEALASWAKSKNAIFLYSTNEAVLKKNMQSMQQLPSSTVRSWALHMPGKKQPETTYEQRKLLLQNEGSDSKAPPYVDIAKGERVMLTKNIKNAISLGLVNGATGTIYDIIHHYETPPHAYYCDSSTAAKLKLKPPIVLVQFDRQFYRDDNDTFIDDSRANLRVPRIVPICPEKSMSKIADFYRYQLPLKPTWAKTIHKAQGLTLDAVVTNLDEGFSQGLAYVAISRVRKLEDIAFETPLTLNTFKERPQKLADILKEADRLKELAELTKPRLVACNEQYEKLQCTITI